VKKEDLLTLRRPRPRAAQGQVFMVSATTGDGVADLKAALAARHARGPVAFPRGPGLRRHRPDDRRRADPRAALPPAPRRAALCERVETEKWEDRKDGSTVIHQQILVERDSQKAIVLGKGGRPQGDRPGRARRSPSISAARSTCSCTSRSNPRWDEDRGLYREIGLDWADYQLAPSISRGSQIAGSNRRRLAPIRS
jgi:GTP-binding protein Era